MATTSAKPSLPSVLAAFAAVYLIWGSTYLGIRFAIETIPPFSMAGVRFLIAGVVLFILVRLQGYGWPRAAYWRSAFVIGMLLLVLGNGLLTWAEQFVPSGVAALIVATVPMWMVLLDALRPGGFRPGASVVFGLALGTVGIGILIGPSSLGEGQVDLVGTLVIGFAAFSWALGSIYSRSAEQSPSTLQNVGMQMLLGGAVLLAAGFSMGERIELDQISAKSGWALIYLAIIGGVVSYSAYVWLLKVSTPAKVSTYAYVNPVVAVLLGWALADEVLGPRIFLATAAVVVAVMLIISSRNRASGDQPTVDPTTADQEVAPDGSKMATS